MQSLEHRSVLSTHFVTFVEEEFLLMVDSQTPNTTVAMRNAREPQWNQSRKCADFYMFVKRDLTSANYSHLLHQLFLQQSNEDHLLPI